VATPASNVASAARRCDFEARTSGWLAIMQQF
jgi:hypothetical protein